MSSRRFAPPSSISPEAQAFIAAQPAPQPRRITLETIEDIRRESREAYRVANDAVCRDLGTTLEETEIEGVAVQVVVPRGYSAARDGRALLYFFGGGHVQGSPSEDRAITARLADHLGLKVYAPHYRLAPENPYPAGLDDASAVYRSLIGALGSAGLAVAGESAGGNLALATILRARDAGLPLPAAAALLSPWSDLTAVGDSYATNAGLDPTLHPSAGVASAAEAYAGDRDKREPLVSPLYADFAPGFPPTLITTGTRDLLLSDCVRLSTALRGAGVAARLHVWEAMWHVFEFYAAIPEGQRSLREIAAFLEDHLGLMADNA